MCVLRWTKILAAATAAFHAMHARALLLEKLSAGAYYLSANTCGPIDTEKATEAMARIDSDCRCTNPQSPNLSSLRKLADKILGSQNDKLVDRFFNYIGNERAQDLRCAARQVEKANDLPSKIYVLSELRAGINTAIKKLQSPQVVGKICPLTLEDLKYDYSPQTNPEYYTVCESLIRHRIAYESTLHSIAGVNVPDYRTFIEHEALRPKSEGLEERLNLAKARASAALRQAAQDFEKTARGENGKSFDRNARTALMNDPYAVQRAIEQEPVLKAVACKADAEYGKGATALDIGLTVGSLALTGGATAIARAGTLAGKVLRGATVARAEGLLYARTTRIIQISAAGLDTVGAYSSMDRECFSNKPAALIASTKDGKCSDQAQVKEAKQTQCALHAVLNSLQFAALASTIRSSKYIPLAAEERLAPPHGRTGLRKSSTAPNRATLDYTQHDQATY